MNSRLPCCMRVENVELAVWARDRQERDSKNHKVLLLTKNSYLINNRGGLRGQGRGLAYWLISVHWSVWANPPWRPSFVIFFIIYCPYSPFDILNSYKTLMYWQIVSQSILKFKKCRIMNEILLMNFRMKHKLLFTYVIYES